MVTVITSEIWAHVVLVIVSQVSASQNFEMYGKYSKILLQNCEEHSSMKTK
jgi:hypothetical protein